MVTDDPHTPGDGHWELNLATTGSQSPRRREIEWFDADINYGLGDRVQLKLDVPWTSVHVAGARAHAGPGTLSLGVKWRWLDRDDGSPLAVSTFPQYFTSWSAFSRRHDIASPNDEFFLPVEVATEVGGFDLDAELGRDFIAHEPDQWALGFVAGHSCGAAVDCLAEIRRTEAPHLGQTLVNFGLTWRWSESLVGLASAGRDVGPRSAERRQWLFYLGVQWLR